MNIISVLIHPFVLGLAFGAGGGLAGFYVPQILRHDINVPLPKLTPGLRRSRYHGLWLHIIIGALAGFASTLTLLDAFGDPRIPLPSLMLFQFLAGMGGAQVLLALRHKYFPKP